MLVLGLQRTARAAGPAPACTPSTLDTSAQFDGSVTVSPLPGSRDATPQTQISFLGVPAGELSACHRHRLAHRAPQRASGGATRRATARASCPRTPFAEGETVTVRARLRTGGARPAAVRPVRDRLPGPDQHDARDDPPGGPSEIQSFRSRPDLRPPVADRDGAAPPAVAPGDDVRRALRRTGPGGPMILDPGGGLVWFKPLPRGYVGDEPAGAAVRRPPGADVVAGRHLRARLRAWRRRDRRQRYRTSLTCAPATACRRTCTSSS